MATTEVLVKKAPDGEPVITIWFEDQHGEPNSSWFQALADAAAGRELSIGQYGRVTAPAWIKLIQTHYPEAVIEVRRRK